MSKDIQDAGTPESTNTPQVGMEQLASMIGAAVGQQIAAQNPKKETFGAYSKRINKGRSVLTRQCFQNGHLIQPAVCSNKEIDLLNQITHTGRYIDRKIEVIVQEEGADSIVYLRYNDKTADQRFEMKGLARDFTDMLQQIVAAQELERVEMDAVEEKKVAARRKFGETKAFKEASAAAANR